MGWPKTTVPPALCRPLGQAGRMAPAPERNPAPTPRAQDRWVPGDGVVGEEDGEPVGSERRPEAVG